MNTQELINIFSYHPPFGDQEVRYQIIREQAKTLAVHIERWCPRSREKSLAITKLQECVMMANAAIAIHETKPEVAPDDERPAAEMPTLDSMPDPPEHHEVSEAERAEEQAEKEEQQELAEEEAEIPPEVLSEAEDDERAEIEAQEEGII